MKRAPRQRVAREFKTLVAFLARLPAIERRAGRVSIGHGRNKHGWWVKFRLDVGHPLAWSTVQELGHVLNYVSIEERLPTLFMPVSPPPYLNGGPRSHLSWVIECEASQFRPADCAQWLDDRLPRPVEDAKQWEIAEDEEELTPAEPSRRSSARREKGAKRASAGGRKKTSR